MALATLSIDLEANLAKFEANLGRVSRQIDKLAADAKTSFGAVGQVFTGSLMATAAEESIRALVQLFPELINGVAAFQDLSEETGASAAALASFQTSADVSGVSVKDLAGLMVKLTGNLAKLTDEGKGAGAALKSLGIPVEEFKALAPDEQIKRLAEQFGKFADGSGKTAVALSLFGKSGAQVLKFFNEYQTGAGASNKLTAEMIELADRWGDAQARSRSELRQTAQIIAVQTLPALTALTDSFREGGKAVLGIGKSTGDLKISNDILDWAEKGALAIGAVLDVSRNAVRVIGLLSSMLHEAVLYLDVINKGAMVVVRKLMRRDTTGIEDFEAALEAHRKLAVDVQKKAVDLFTTSGAVFSEAVAKNFRRMRTSLEPEVQRELAKFNRLAAGANGEKPELKFTLPDKDAEARDKAFQSFLANLAKQDSLAQAQIETGGKLADSDRRRIELLTDLSDASKGFSLAQKVEGESAVAAYTQKLKLIEADQELARVRKWVADQEERGTSARLKEVESLMLSNQALADQTEEVGLTGEALEKLRITRLENTKALEIEALITLQNAGASEAEISAQERKIALLERQIGLRNRLNGRTNEVAGDPVKGATDALDAYLTKIRESGTATREVVGQSLSLLEDDLTAGLAKGRLDLSRTVDYMISEFMRLQVVRPLLNSLFSSLGSGGGKFLASLFGFANGGAFDGGRLMAFAQGSIVDSPTLFKFANGTGLMGEAGPEAVLPLKRGPGGKLGVIAQGGMGGGNVTVIQHVTIGSGVNRNEVMAAMEQAKRSAVAAIYDAQRRGREIA